MLSFIKSECLKQKRLFTWKLVWLVPVVTVLLAMVMMGGNYLQTGAYNWWYTLLLPGSFTVFTAFTTAGESKRNRHGLLAVVPDQRKLWLAQMIVCILYLAAACGVFFLLIQAGSLLIGSTITPESSAAASLLLFIGFAWQIPLWMAATQLTGKYMAVLFSLICNFAVGVLCAAGSAWWVPFAIPSRMMCSVIGILPNGLPVESGSHMADSTVLLPSVFITFVLLLVMSVTTTNWYGKREVYS